MTDAPERIVIDHARNNLWYTEEGAKWGPLDMTTYVRADIHEAEIERLRWQVAELKASLDYALSCTDKEAEDD